MKSLTPREREVAYLVGEGHASPAVAEILGLSTHTVRGYAKRAARKLPGRGGPRAKLTRWALSHIEIPPN